jgi:hypothetical protein
MNEEATTPPENAAAIVPEAGAKRESSPYLQTVGIISTSMFATSSDTANAIEVDRSLLGCHF